MVKAEHVPSFCWYPSSGFRDMLCPAPTVSITSMSKILALDAIDLSVFVLRSDAALPPTVLSAATQDHQESAKHFGPKIDLGSCSWARSVDPDVSTSPAGQNPKMRSEIRLGERTLRASTPQQFGPEAGKRARPRSVSSCCSARALVV